jgi:hypothetical protein
MRPDIHRRRAEDLKVEARDKAELAATIADQASRTVGLAVASRLTA